MSFAKKYTGVLSTRTDPNSINEKEKKIMVFFIFLIYLFFLSVPPFPASRPNLKFKFRVAFVLKKKVSLYKIF